MCNAAKIRTGQQFLDAAGFKFCKGLFISRADELNVKLPCFHTSHIAAAVNNIIQTTDINYGIVPFLPTANLLSTQRHVDALTAKVSTAVYLLNWQLNPGTFTLKE